MQRSEFEAHLQACVVSENLAPPLGEMIAYHFGYGGHEPARQGKRLRPNILVSIASERGDALDRSLDAAAAIEILHNYSLVHDDIEDRDELRRGRKTLWSVYGVAQAINAGDAMCALSFLTLARAGAYHPANRVTEMIRVLHRAHLTMCEGQALDIAFETAARVDLESYCRMIGGKTAALFGAACELGALCAGSDAVAAAQCREAGIAFGMAFQIRDDVQGIWGDAAATGKTAANDVARRKWTFPVVWALGEPASAARSAVVDAYARGGAIEAGEVLRVVAALGELGAREAADSAAAEHLKVIERSSQTGVLAFI